MTARISDFLQRKLDTLPDGPGVYLWKDGEGNVLYVGKAKRLSSRVRSYFATDFPETPKNRLLVRLAADVETIVVPNELQALVLENNLIKEFRPRFNVRLRDDKSYPSIAVTLNENLDYFGQTVNVAARVQSLAEASEICISEALYAAPGVTELLTGLKVSEFDAPLRGVEGNASVYRVVRE